MIMYQLD